MDGESGNMYPWNCKSHVGGRMRSVRYHDQDPSKVENRQVGQDQWASVRTTEDHFGKTHQINRSGGQPEPSVPRSVRYPH